MDHMRELKGVSSTQYTYRYLYRGQTNSKCTTSEWNLEIHKAYPEPIIIVVNILNVNVKQWRGIHRPTVSGKCNDNYIVYVWRRKNIYKYPLCSKS